MTLDGKRVVVLVAEGFEDLEYWVTVMQLREEGAEVISVGPDLEPVHGKNALSAQADAGASDVDASELDAVVIPGGWARTSYAGTGDHRPRPGGPRGRQDRRDHLPRRAGRHLRRHSEGRQRDWLPRHQGRFGERGATWVDKPAFREGNLVWGRVVPDIPAFCRELVAPSPSSRGGAARQRTHQ